MRTKIWFNISAKPNNTCLIQQLIMLGLTPYFDDSSNKIAKPRTAYNTTFPLKAELY
jgi:hypothetical protein